MRIAAIMLGFAAMMLAATAAPAPKAGIADLSALPIVTMHPYDEQADADAAVAAAFARARKNHKRVLIDLGGNWCPDCIVLANVMRLPGVAPFITAHYEVVAVNVGRFDTNLQIPARFGITGRLEGVPSVLIATPNGKLINRGHTTALVDARAMTPQAIIDWLASWTK
ncbi:MAG TPA: thioredoxin family protein [Rhizomicrobium sp.]